MDRLGISGVIPMKDNPYPGGSKVVLEAVAPKPGSVRLNILAGLNSGEIPEDILLFKPNTVKWIPPTKSLI